MKKNKYIAIAVVVVCLLATVVGAVKLCRYYLPHGRLRNAQKSN